MKLIRAFVISALTITLAQADPGGFTVTGVNGGAEIGADQSSYGPATKGQVGPLGWWARTPENGGSLTVMFNESNKFRLLSGAEAQINGEDDSDGSWHRVISLKFGAIDITHGSTVAQVVKLDCETPGSLCGAEGTEFTVDASKGIFTVTTGKIHVSSSREPALSLAAVTSGGVLVYTPGSKTTWCDWKRSGGTGAFGGIVTIGTLKLMAVGADFTIAKELGAPNKTIVKIATGKIDKFGPGLYLVKAGVMAPVPAALKDTAVAYLKASKKESALCASLLAYQAAGRPPVPATLKADVETAAAATRVLAAALF